MSEASSDGQTPSARLFYGTLAATLLIGVGPLLLDLWTGDDARVFGFLVADFFYYFTVARNYVELGLLSFDQMSQTNGFHPLWQLAMIGLYWIATLLEAGDIAFFRWVLYVNIALIGVALTMLAYTWRAAEGRIPVLFPLVGPSIFGLLTRPFYDRLTDYGPFQTVEGQRPVVGTIWHYANGMETALLIAFFSVFVWYYVKRGLPRSAVEAVVFGVLAAGVTLSRLDHIFFSGALLGVWVIVSLVRRDWPALRTSLVSWTVFAALVGAYLAFNKSYTDALLPLSGTVKSSYPFVSNDGIGHAIKFFRFRSSTPIHIVYRQAQIWLPLLAALGYVLACFRAKVDEAGIRVELRRPPGKLDGLMLALIPAIVSLAAYNFLFVAPYDQGTWYFPLSTIYVSFATVRGLDVLLRRFVTLAWVPPALLLAVTVGGGLFYFPANHHTDFHRDVADFYLVEAPQMVEFYESRNIEPSVIEYYDGVFAAATRYPTFSGFGLVVDKEAARAKKRGDLFTIAYKRGFHRIHSFYVDAASFSTAPNTKELTGKFARWIDKKQLKGLKLQVEYLSKSGKYAVIKVSRVPKTKKQKRKRGKGRVKRPGKKKAPREPGRVSPSIGRKPADPTGADAAKRPGPDPSQNPSPDVGVKPIKP